MSQLSVDILPAVQHLITEDDTPVDNWLSEKQQRLLTEPLYSSWVGSGDGRTFLAAANVGIFFMARNPPIVPDMFLSLDVQVANNWWQREHRSYFVWEFGQIPEVVLEIVSNTEGGEDGEKKRKYAQMRINYYVIYDPQHQVMPETLTLYKLGDAGYERQDSRLLPILKLGLTLWDGVFEEKHDTWLRWTNAEGGLIPTGKESALEARQSAIQERQRADAAQEQAEATEERADTAQEQAEAARAQAKAARQRAERLAAMLRQAGLDPDQA